MASGKRASMREGPLAALFRKTDEDGTAEREPRAARRRGRRARRARGARAPPPSPSPRPAPVAGVRRRAADGPRPRMPTPQERLRHAFSLRDPRGHARPAARPRPRDAYAALRARRSSTSPPPRAGVGKPVHARRRRRRRRRQRGQPHGRGRGRGRRVHRHQHRPPVAAAVGTPTSRCTSAPSVTRGLGSGSNPELGRAGRDGGVRPDQGAAQGLGHGVHRRRRRRRHRHRRGSGRRAHRPRARRADRRHRHQAVRLRGLAPRASRPSVGVAGAGRRGRHADRRARTTGCCRCSTSRRRWSTRSASPTTCCARACRASRDLVTLPGLINLDFADVRTIMSEAGNALLGIGMGTGERRAIDAAEQAVASPLLETSMEGARSILLSITGGTRPVAVGGQRGRQGGRRGRPPRRQHHLRRDGRREARRTRSGSPSWRPATATAAGAAPRSVEEPAGEPRVRAPRAAAGRAVERRGTGLGVGRARRARVHAARLTCR